MRRDKGQGTGDRKLETGDRGQGTVRTSQGAGCDLAGDRIPYSVLSTQYGVLNSQAKSPLGLLLITLVLAGCGPVAADTKQPATPAGGPLEVVMAGSPVRKTLTLTSIQPARVAAIEQTPLHSRVSGYVAEVLVDYGDPVKAGQPLIKLSVPELEVDVVQKQALIDQAASEVKQAEAVKRAAESAVVTANSKVKEAEARLVKTQADVHRWHLQCTRYKDLAKSGSVNEQLVEEAEQNCQAAEAADQEAEAAIDAMKAAVDQAQAGTEKAEADIVAAQARQRVAEANLKYAQTMLDYAQITAPFAGVVTRREVDPGHYVQPAGQNGDLLLVVARTDVIRVFIAIPEHEAGYVDVGDEVTIEVQSLRGAAFAEKVTRTSFALDPANRSLETIVDLDNRDGRLRPGMYATARLKLDERKDALTLPSAAVVRQAGEAFCYRLVDGKAAKTAIQLGVRVGDDFEIATGLADGDTVILNKAAGLKDAQPVEVLQPAA